MATNPPVQEKSWLQAFTVKDLSARGLPDEPILLGNPSAVNYLTFKCDPAPVASDIRFMLDGNEILKITAAGELQFTGLATNAAKHFMQVITEITGRQITGAKTPAYADPSKPGDTCGTCYCDGRCNWADTRCDLPTVSRGYQTCQHEWKPSRTPGYKSWCSKCDERSKETKHT